MVTTTSCAQAEGASRKRSNDGRSASNPAEGAPEAKRRRLEQPNVTVVVGGQEFQHYSQFLCFTSDYFDGILNSDCKEAHEKRIVFADKDPEEWRLVSSFLEPFSSAKVTKDNVDALLPWADYLGISHLLRACDETFHDLHLGDRFKWHSGKWGKLISDLVTSSTFQLPKSKKKACERVSNLLCHVLGVVVDYEDTTIEQLLDLMKRDEECLELLWDAFKRYLPMSLKENDSQSLLANDMLPTILQARMELEIEILSAVKQRKDLKLELRQAKIEKKSLQEKHEQLVRELPVELYFEFHRRAREKGVAANHR